MPDTRITSALQIGSAQRLEIMQRFFSTYSGTAGGPPGLGRAALDFVGWLGDSGRLDNACGSPWWRALNGALVLDLAAALEGDRADGSTTRAWRAYVDAAGSADTGTGQALFWHAHQTSLHTVIPTCRDLLAAEPLHEREFIACAIEIVDLAALREQPTDSDALGLLTRRLYPNHYPLAEPLSTDLCRLRAAASKQHAGERIGLESDIWAEDRRAAG